MTAFEMLVDAFGTNWTTLLVGWNGLGVLSPWPNRKDEHPPLLTRSEIASYADKVLEAASDSSQLELLTRLSLLDLNDESKEDIGRILEQLAKQESANPAFELRKWRVILLERLLCRLPADPLYALIELTEFWQTFGYPPDSPHIVQGRGNQITPNEYYTTENLNRILARHRDWIKRETGTLRSGARIDS